MKLRITIILFVICHLSFVICPIGYASQATSTNYEVQFVASGTSLNYPVSSLNEFTYFIFGEPIFVPNELLSSGRRIVFGEEYYYLVPGGGVDYAIARVLAKTHILGVNIAPAVWQDDNDPYFYWIILITPPTLIDGFSFSLDTLPDRVVDTAVTYYQYPQGSLTDGRHTFYVAPFAGGTSWGDPVGFEIWIDMTAPQINEVTPHAGAVINEREKEITCRIRDSSSGVDKDSLEFYLNRERLAAEFNEAEGVYSYRAVFYDGEKTVLVKAKDLAGNEAVKSWSFIVDVEEPLGAILINNGDPLTNSAYVSLKIQSSDTLSGIKYMYISNDGIFDTEMKNPLKFSPQVDNWLLADPDISEEKTVYLKLEDNAGNISQAFSDSINLTVTTPDTMIISGPESLSEKTSAEFYYQASRKDCVFSFFLDKGGWSAWQKNDKADFSGLSLDSHLFKVKAGFDTNADGKITIDEEDPTPAQWTWTVKEDRLIERLRKILFFRRK